MNAQQSDDPAIEATARHWAVRLSGEELAPWEQARFETWRDAAPANRAAFDEAMAVMKAVAGLSHLRGLATLPEVQPSLARRVLSAPAVRYGAMAAAVLLLLSGTLLPLPFGGNGAVYATEVAQIRDVTLDDGSIVTLGAQSRIQVSFTDAERLVRLDSGEAFFNVVSQPQRPFRVVAGDTVVQVVGTKFDVNRGPQEKVRVSVLEGTVHVQPADPQPAAQKPALVILKPGDQVVTAGAQVRVKPSSPHAPAVASWRQGYLSYEDATLAEVVADARRYYNGDIILASRDLGSLKVTASFRADQIGRFMQTLPEILPVQTRVNGSEIVLQRAEVKKG